MRGSSLHGRGHNTPWRRVWCPGAAIVAIGTATIAWPGQVSAPFVVNVQLHASETCSAALESPTQSSPVLIDCRAKPLEPVPTGTKPRSDGQAFRFHIPSSNGETRFGAVDLYAGAGTITSWRVVHLTDWDYLEMTVGW